LFSDGSVCVELTVSVNRPFAAGGKLGTNAARESAAALFEAPNKMVGPDSPIVVPRSPIDVVSDNGSHE
jgi:hypothetical protein